MSNLPEHVSGVSPLRQSGGIDGAAKPRPRRRRGQRKAPEYEVSQLIMCWWCDERFLTERDARLHMRDCGSREKRAGSVPHISPETFLSVFHDGEDDLLSAAIAERLADADEAYEGVSAWQVGKALSRLRVRTHVIERGKRGIARADLEAARLGIEPPSESGQPPGIYAYRTRLGLRYAYKIVMRVGNGRTRTEERRGFLSHQEADDHLKIQQRIQRKERSRVLREQALARAASDGKKRVPILRCSCSPRCNECARLGESGHGQWWVRLSLTLVPGRREPVWVKVGDYIERGGLLRKPRIRMLNQPQDACGDTEQQETDLQVSIPEFSRISPERAHLSDEQVQRGHATYRRMARKGQRVPDEIVEVHNEYNRRQRRGELTS